MNDGKIGVCLIGDYVKCQHDNCWLDCSPKCTSEPNIDAELPFWFWGALRHIYGLALFHSLGKPKFATHSELLPGHTDCGKGVIQRLVNELNEYYG
jgi:hypothetical protein